MQDVPLADAKATAIVVRLLVTDPLVVVATRMGADQRAVAEAIPASKDVSLHRSAGVTHYSKFTLVGAGVNAIAAVATNPVAAIPVATEPETLPMSLRPRDQHHRARSLKVIR